MATRDEVYTAIDSERDYQEMRIVRDGSTSLEVAHTPEEYVLYMEYYLQLAREAASTIWGPAAKPAILDIIRKVTTLGVACMEANGAPHRENSNGK